MSGRRPAAASTMAEIISDTPPKRTKKLRMSAQTQHPLGLDQGDFFLPEAAGFVPAAAPWLAPSRTFETSCWATSGSSQTPAAHESPSASPNAVVTLALSTRPLPNDTLSSGSGLMRAAKRASDAFIMSEGRAARPEHMFVNVLFRSALAGSFPLDLASWTSWRI